MCVKVDGGKWAGGLVGVIHFCHLSLGDGVDKISGETWGHKTFGDSNKKCTPSAPRHLIINNSSLTLESLLYYIHTLIFTF